MLKNNDKNVSKSINNNFKENVKHYWPKLFVDQNCGQPKMLFDP